MIFKFYEAQIENIRSKDRVTNILKDLEVINMNISIEDIKAIQKGAYLNMLKMT